MATVTGLTAERMLEIEGASVVDGEVVGDELILTTHDGATINAGNVRGPVAEGTDVTDSQVMDVLNLPDSETLEFLDGRYTETFRIKDFGAVGNGIADDTEAARAFLTKLLYDENFIINGSFDIPTGEDANAYFFPHALENGASYVTAGSVQFLSGTRAARISVPQDAAYKRVVTLNGGLTDLTANHRRVQVGETYRFRIWVRNSSGDPKIKPAIYVRDSSGAFIQTVYGTVIDTQPASTQTQWFLAEVNHKIVDANASYIVAGIEVLAATTNPTLFYIEDAVLYKEDLTARREGVVDPGVYRVTSSLRVLSSPQRLSLRGAGANKSYFWGDFVGAGKGILEVSGYRKGASPNTLGQTTGYHRISGIGFFGRGVPGDPIGLLMENAFECIVDDIDAPAPRTEWLMPSGVALLNNSVIFVTNDNNSKFNNIRSQGGFQPRTWDVSAYRVDFTSGSTAITAKKYNSSTGLTETTTDIVFTSDMVGKSIYFNMGADTGHTLWRGIINSVTDGQHAVLAGGAQSTQTDAKFGVDIIRGTIALNSNSLQLINMFTTLSDDWIGMQVHILGADVKAGAENTAGLLSTTITAVNNTTKVLTLADNATAAATSTTVLFCPAVFMGALKTPWRNPDSQKLNHSWWTNVHTEGYSACGLIVNSGQYLAIDRLKLHGAAYPYASDWSECYYGAVLSDIESMSMRDVQMAYGVLGAKIAISASGGTVTVDDMDINHLRFDVSPITISNPHSAFQLSLGTMRVQDLNSSFPANYKMVSSPDDRYVSAHGPVFYKSMVGKASKTSPVISSGFTSMNKSVGLVNTGQRYEFVPPGDYGIIAIAGSHSTMGAVVFYKKNAATGNLTLIGGAGSCVTISADLTTLDGGVADGTTADRVNVAMRSDGTNYWLQIQNRRTTTGSSVTSYFSFSVISFGVASA